MNHRRVNICYDSDIVSNQRVQSAEKRLAVALIQRKADVYTVRLPGAPDGGKQGADDFIKARGKTAFAKLIRTAEPVNLNTIMNGATSKPLVEWFADLEVVEVQWLWKDRIACGMLNAIVGDPGQGKSTLALEIAAKGSRGREPYTDAACEPFTTLYLSNENDHRITSKPRFLAMGGDETRIAALDHIQNPDGTVRPVTLDDVGAIERAITESKAKLVVIDPLQSYIGANVDTNKANQTRAKLDPLVGVAKRTGAAIVIVSHMAKASSARPIHAMLGSVDISGAMRLILMVGTPPDNREDRALLMVKSSIGPYTDGLSFRIVKVAGKGSVTRIEWIGTSTLTYADLRAAEKAAKPKTQKERAAEWLRAALAKGPRPAVELVEEWADFSGLDAQPKGRAERSLQVAAKEINCTHFYEGGKHGKRMWKLPPPRKFDSAYRKQPEDNSRTQVGE